MISIAEPAGFHKPAEALVERICRSPEGHLAIRRTECLLEVIRGYPLVLRRFYLVPETGKTQSATYRIVPADIPAALFTMLYGEADWLPAGMIRVYGAGDEQTRVYLQRVDPTSQRVGVIPEYAPTQRTRCLAYDFDGPNHSNPLKDALGSAVATYQALASQGMPAYLVRSHSGQGYHLWVFLETEVDSRVARHLARHLLTGAMTDASERAKVEINPKWHDPRAQGYALTLPWHAGAMPEHNVVFDPGSGHTVSLPPGGVFARLPYARLYDLLQQCPPLPSEEDERRGHSANQARQSCEPANAFSTWANQVGGHEGLLQQVYGPYLTGRIVQGKYLECRDPASPTGDRTPSARVNPNTGWFQSFRGEGRDASIFAMMVELGLASSKAEATRIAGQVTGQKLTSSSHGLSAPYGSRMFPCEEIEPPTLTPLTMPEARAHLAQILQQQIVPLAQRHARSVNLIRGGTGIGKSTQCGQLFAAIARCQVLDQHDIPMRAVYATHSRAKINELVDEYLMGSDGLLLPGVAIAYPRSPHEADPGYCRRYTQAEALTKCNQSVNALLCTPCQQQMREEAQATWEAMSKKERRKTTLESLQTPCPYQANQHQQEEARVVVGVRHSFQHGGKRLEDFDLIVIDEQSEEAFFQTTHFTAAALSVWEHRMAKKAETAAVLFPVLTAMKRALVAGPAEGVDQVNHAVPLLPILHHIDPEIGSKLYALHEHLQEIKWEGHHPGKPEQAIMGTFVDLPTCEEVWDGTEAIPMRGLSALVETLRAEALADHPIRDTRVWVRLPYGNHPGGIFLVAPRTQLIESVSKRVTVFLDATAYVPIMDRLFDRALTVYPIPVQPKVQVQLCGDALYRWEDLKDGGWRMDTLRHDIQRKCARFNRVLVLGEQASRDTIEPWLPPHAEMEHWFSAEMAGSNRYADCDAAICIGHPREPVDALVYRMAALRWPDDLAGTLPADRPDLFATEEILVPVPGFRDTKDRQWGRLIPYPADPDLQQYARHRLSTAITQGVGRIRPAESETIKFVFLYTGEPAQDLPVDRLMTLERSIREEDPEYLRAHPYRGKPGTATKPRPPAPDRKAASFTKYLQAGEVLRAEGKAVTVYTLQERVGGSTRTAARYLPRVLEALAIRQGNRQAMRAELSGLVDPEYAWAWAQLAYAQAEEAFPAILPLLEGLKAQDWEKHWLRTAYDSAHVRGTPPRNAANFARAKAVFADDAARFRRWAEAHQEMWAHATPADPTRDTPPEMTAAEWVDQAFTVWWGSLSPEMAAAVVADKMQLF